FYFAFYFSLACLAVLNLSGFLFECQGDPLHLHTFPTRRSSDLYDTYGGGIPAFYNAGLVQVAAETNSAWLNATNFLNTGTVQVQSGALSVDRGISRLNTFHIRAGSTFDFVSSSSVFNSGSSSTGAGRLF